MHGKLICRNCLATGKGLGTQGGERDPKTAFLLELVGGFLGLLGIGFLYSGRTNEGVIRLILWILYDIFAAVVISQLFIFVVGFCCLPIQLII
jgi:hypothetical protein